jgi:hypothetical protein
MVAAANKRKQQQAQSQMQPGMAPTRKEAGNQRTPPAPLSPANATPHLDRSNRSSPDAAMGDLPSPPGTMDSTMVALNNELSRVNPQQLAVGNMDPIHKLPLQAPSPSAWNPHKSFSDASQPAQPTQHRQRQASQQDGATGLRRPSSASSTTSRPQSAGRPGSAGRNGSVGGVDENMWKAVGQRRQSAVGSEQVQPVAPQADDHDDDVGNVPIFQYFGGRSHGQRSFSLSVHPSEGAYQHPNSHLRGQSDNHQQSAASAAYHNPRRNSHQPTYGAPNRMMYREPPAMMAGSIIEEEQPIPQQHMGKGRRQSTYNGGLAPPGMTNGQPRNRSKSSSHIFGDFGGMWGAQQQQDNNLAPIAEQSHLGGMWQQGTQQFANGPLGAPPGLNGFMSQGSTLMGQRRHSLAPSFTRNHDPLVASFQRQLSINVPNDASASPVLDMGQLPPEFAEEYGTMIDDSTIVAREERHTRRRSLSVSSQLSSDSPTTMNGYMGHTDAARFATSIAPRSSSASSTGRHSTTASPAIAEEALARSCLKGREHLYVVEFRAGRKDYFYLPVGFWLS